MRPKIRNNVVTVRLGKLEREALATIAARENITRSEVIRAAIREALTRREIEPLTLADRLAMEVAHAPTT